MTPQALVHALFGYDLRSESVGRSLDLELASPIGVRGVAGRAAKEAKKRRATARTQKVLEARRAIEAGAPPPGAAPRVIAPRGEYESRQTGLQALRNRGKITDAQEQAGKRYGMLFRVSAIEGDASIGSNLASLTRVDRVTIAGASADGEPRLNPAEFHADCRRRYAMARFEGLSGVVSLIAVCDVICGKEWTPQMVTPNRDAQIQIETSLRDALELLRVHFRRSGHAAADLG